jgi:uncharacterized protein YchJ
MNIQTGELVEQEIIDTMTEIEKKNYIPVMRDLSKVEKYKRQIALYAPCACGSGNKFKFCCHSKKQ